jgi:hypothetical protein
MLGIIALFAALVGGWASITVENLPDHFVVGKPTNITFSIRQHGHNLLPNLSPVIDATNGKTQMTARAVETNKPGFYTATVTPTQSGDWSLTIQSGFGRSNQKLMPIRATTSDAVPAVAMSDVEYGKRLVVSKGCLACHTHNDVKEYGGETVGPNLTNTQLPREYLAKFLDDPEGVKKNWSKEGLRMPDLGLKSNEIAALVTFVTARNTALNQ